MSYTNKSINEWIKTLNTTTLCLEELEKLNTEKQELIKLATSKNPPANIIDLLEESKQKFVALEKHTKELSENMRTIKKEFLKTKKKK